MYVATEHHDGTVVVRPAGELDLATAPDLERVLGDLLGRHWAVVLDLSEVTFADCAGLRPVRWALAQPYLVSVRTSGIKPHVRRVLELTGLSGTTEPSTA
jgi:stage II sporulation protein AA (anti-sigma F factor antagonist)